MKAEPPGQRRDAHWQQQLKPREGTSAVPLGTERVLGGCAPCGGSVPPPPITALHGAMAVLFRVLLSSWCVVHHPLLCKGEDFSVLFQQLTQGT